MGFLKQMKDMKNTLHEAPGMIAQAQELGAQAKAYGEAQQAAMAGGGMGAPGAPATVTAADLEPISGISLERYAQLAKSIGTRSSRAPSSTRSSPATATAPPPGRPRTTAGTPA